MSKQTFEVKRREYVIEVDTAAQEVSLPDGQPLVRLIAAEGTRMALEQAGRRAVAYVAREGERTWVHVGGKTILVRAVQPERGRSTRARKDNESGIVLSPMPGQVRAVLVEAGARVTEGQPLLLLEAMKMELRIPAPFAGRVAELGVAVGDTVEREQILARVEPRADGAKETDASA